jgi:hypothetical protein
MNTLRKILALLLVTFTTVYACQNNEVEPEKLSGSVQFSLGEIESGTRGSAAQEDGLQDARAILITIIDDQGNPVYSQKQIKVFNFSGTMVGEPISLNAGNYQLTEFLVLDDQGTVIYATPIAGSEYEHLVNDPLPIDFTISADETIQVSPEVVDVATFSPEAFGYASFRFTLVEHFNFLIAAFVYDSNTQGLILSSANLTIYELGTDNILLSTTLGNQTNTIAVRDGFDYRFVVEKDGFITSDVNFTNAELKSHTSEPLKVILHLANAQPSNSFVDSGQTFSTHADKSALSGDLDNDGDMDLFIARINGAPTEVLFNDGNGNFTEIRSLGILVATNAALGDVDGDGDLDVFMTYWSELPNVVYLNDGAGNFTNSGQALGGNASYSVSLGDLDNDGDLDAVVSEGNFLSILLNDGAGVFSQSSQITGTTGTQEVGIGDLNGDGSLDLYVINQSVSDLIFFNDGSANFTNSGQALGTADSYAVTLGDIDGDSDLDAFIGNLQGPDKVWINDGAGNFTDSGQQLGSDDTNDLILMDFDLDGDLDAFTVHGNNSAHILWLNNGNGIFTKSGQSFGSFQSTRLCTADFDRDGDIDVFVANFGGSDVLWVGEQN